MTTVKLNFISGLPRSGSTLLSAILRQNPRFHAAMSSPVADIVGGLVKGMGAANPLAFKVTDTQRVDVITSAVSAFYAMFRNERVVFDTNRGWCALLPALARVFPDAHVLCCLRSPAWVLDSVERLIQGTPLQASRLFGFEPIMHQNARVLSMISKGGFIEMPLSSLQQAWFSEHAGKLIAIRYESLAAQPQKVIAQLYDALGERHFEHDFETISYSEPEFDELAGMPNLHTVKPKVQMTERQTILAPEIFARYEKGFWDMPGQNPRNVTIL